MSDHSGRAGGCCVRCCSFIFTSGLTALFLWLSLRGSDPTCSIEDFYVPSLNTSSNPTTTRSDHTLYFDLKLQNQMKDKGVGYDDLNLTFFYGHNNNNNSSSNNSLLQIANYTFPGFKQGHGKNTHRKEVVQTYGVPWRAAYTAVSNGSTVTFRVGLATRVRYKILFFFTKRHGFKVGANVDVNNSGKKVSKKGVKLRSGAPQHFCYPALVGISIALYFLILLL